MLKEWFDRRKEKQRQKQLRKRQEQMRIRQEIEEEPKIEICRSDVQHADWEELEAFIPRCVLPRPQHFKYCEHDGTQIHRIVNYDYDPTTGKRVFHTTNWLRCESGHRFTVPHSHPNSGYCEICGKMAGGDGM